MCCHSSRLGNHDDVSYIITRGSSHTAPGSPNDVGQTWAGCINPVYPPRTFDYVHVREDNMERDGPVVPAYLADFPCNEGMYAQVGA